MAADAKKRGPGRPPSVKTIAARAVTQALAAQQPEPQGQRVVVHNRFDAAGMGRRLAGWNPPTAGPNRALEGLQRVRNRSQDANQNDWAAVSANQKWATSLIGVGITPRFKRIKSKARRQQITDHYNEFVRTSDADCVLNWYGQQTLAVKAWFASGEVFARRRDRFLDEGLRVPLQVQLIEAEYCPLFDADSFQGLPQTNKIRDGIEFNKRGKRVAYWFYKDHPGDGAVGSYPTANLLVRIPADEVCHIFMPDRPGQRRGAPQSAAVLPRLRNIADFDDAVLTRQQLANLFVGFITRALAKGGVDDSDIDALTGEPTARDGEGRQIVGMQPGLLQELDDGQEVTFANPPEAGTTYSDYMRTQHLGTAAGMGLPYEVMSGDILNISDRTLRVIINEFRRFAEQRQWQVVIPQLCEKVMTWVADAMVLAGLIDVSEYDDVRLAEHSPHGWAYIHPVQDPQGKALEVTNGFRSRSSVIGERGDDPDVVDDERAADDKREQELEIGPYGAAAQQENQPAGNLDPEGDDTPPTKSPAPQNTALLAALEQSAQAIVTLRNQVQALQTQVSERAETAEQANFARILALLEPVGGPQ